MKVEVILVEQVFYRCTIEVESEEEIPSRFRELTEDGFETSDFQEFDSSGIEIDNFTVVKEDE